MNPLSSITDTVKLWIGGSMLAVVLSLMVGLLVTRSTLASTKSKLIAEQSAHRETVANYRAASAKAEAEHTAAARATETRYARISQEAQDDLTRQRDAARALADAYARRLLGGAAPANRSGSGQGDLPGAPTAPGVPAGADAHTLVADIRACTDAVIQARGWQSWWADVSSTPR